ncbi:MAG: EamA family transporter RarD [Spirochaetes bacterium]|jgi:chloramphenicol-sensitive protein RarD|nr:EamA family transporter RarD [Spirochaetota bacterium]
MGTDSEASKRLLVGSLYTFAAFVTWGVLPLYWKLLGGVAAPVILAHRIIWSFVFVSGLLVSMGRFHPLLFLADRRRRQVVLATSVLIAVNWFTYIWAVTTEQLVEASMGYYINPLFSVFLGMVVLRERLTRLEVLALVFATLGVANIALRYGQVPWIAILLMGSFGFYGLLKKLVSVDSLTALSLETAILGPVAVAFLAAVATIPGLADFGGAPAAAGIPGALALAFGGGGAATVVLLVFAGVVTAMPLYWFAQGAQRIPLSQVGFMQYVAPSLMLLIGVFLFGEAFTTVHAVSFGSIWVGLALYSVSRAMDYNRRRVADRGVSG